VNRGLKYAWYDGTKWHTATAQVENVGGFTSLAVDDAGRAHISYHGGFPAGLNYALQPLSINKQVTSTGDVHNNGILTFTLNLAGIGNDMYLSDPLPSTVRYIPDSISTTLTPTAIYSSSVRAVLWHGTAPTYTIPSISFQVMAEITGTGALSVPVPVVNTAWLTDSATGFSVSSTATTPIMPLPLFLDKDALPHSDLRPGDTLTYTLTLAGSGQTVLLQDYLPVEVKYISDSVTGTVMPAAIYSDTTRAISWEGILPVDAVQTIRFQVRLPDADRGAPGPVRAFANTAWLTCTSGLETGRIVSATVDVNVQRIYLPAVAK
jgi:uncharacterized repeat protein (TIGR01451 family)